MGSRAGVALAVVLWGCVSPAWAQADLAAWALSGEQLISAVKVAASQLAVSGQVNTAGEQQSRQALASAVNSQAGAYEAMRARALHGADTGQGYGICATPVAMSSRTIAEASGTKVGSAFGAADAAWLSKGGDAAARAADLQAARKSFYCTNEELAATGWCRPGGKRGIPAGDSNAAVFMKADIGPEEALTAADYIDNAAPLPTIAPSVSNLEQSLGRAADRRRGAMMTAARQTMFAVVNGAMGGDGAEK